MPPVVQRNVTVNGLNVNVGVNNGSVKYQQPNFDTLGKNITQKRNLDEVDKAMNLPISFWRD
jgi:hypothetical protein